MALYEVVMAEVWLAVEAEAEEGCMETELKSSASLSSEHGGDCLRAATSSGL